MKTQLDNALQFHQTALNVQARSQQLLRVEHRERGHAALQGARHRLRAALKARSAPRSAARAGRTSPPSRGQDGGAAGHRSASPGVQSSVVANRELDVERARSPQNTSITRRA